MNDEDGDRLKNRQELERLKAQMKVFAEHKKIMAEFISPKKKVKTNKKK